MARQGMKTARALGAATNQGNTERTLNKAGGEAFEIRDPSLRLLTMVGSSFWNEPTYYGDSPDGERIRGLSDEASAIVETAREIAASEHPRDLLALALWARSEMNVRTTPQVLLAVASALAPTKPFVREYTPRIVQRADEIRQVFAAYVSLHAGGVGANVRGQKVPNSLKRGLADAFGQFSESQILKYDSDVRPTFRDVLRMIDRGRDRGLPQAVHRYLVKGEVTDPAAVPVIAARKRLAQLKALDDEARELIRASHANWEVVLSQFGGKREVWQAVLPEMGYMALLRNLRNLATSGVDLAPALTRLRDPKEVARSRQLPFRFYSAFVTLQQAGALTGAVREALEEAIGHSASNLPRLAGTTVIASDNSGSMSSTVSAKSKVTRQAAANILAAIALRISDAGRVLVFGETAALVPLSPSGGVIANAGLQAATDVGHSTNAHRAVHLMMSQKIRADRLVIFSDMQCWNSDARSTETLAGAVAEYRRKINPDLFVHSVDLAGAGKSPLVPDDPRTHLVSGFSEKILAMIPSFEQATAAVAVAAPEGRGKVRTLPTLDEIRARY